MVVSKMVVMLRFIQRDVPNISTCVGRWPLPWTDAFSNASSWSESDRCRNARNHETPLPPIPPSVTLVDESQFSGLKKTIAQNNREPTKKSVRCNNPINDIPEVNAKPVRWTYYEEDVGWDYKHNSTGRSRPNEGTNDLWLIKLMDELISDCLDTVV